MLTPPAMQAAYAEHCNACEADYPAGTPIVYTTTHGWVHLSCARRAVAAC